MQSFSVTTDDLRLARHLQRVYGAYTYIHYIIYLLREVSAGGGGGGVCVCVCGYTQYHVYGLSGRSGLWSRSVYDPAR